MVSAKALNKHYAQFRLSGYGSGEALLRAVRATTGLRHMEDFSALAVPESNVLDMHEDMADDMKCMSRHDVVVLHVLEEDGGRGWVSYAR